MRRRRGGQSGFTVRNHTQTHTLPKGNITLPCAHLFTLSTHTVTSIQWVRGGGSAGLGVVKGAVCFVMEGRNGFALSDWAVTTALFHV